MKKIFKMVAIAVLLHSCNLGKNHNVLYVKFENNIKKYHFDAQVFKGDTPIGKITNVTSNENYLFYEIELNDEELKFRNGSVIELKFIDLLGSPKMILKEGSKEGFFKNRDTLTGEINDYRSNLTSKNVDSVIKNIDPAIKELLQLDTNGKAR